MPLSGSHDASYVEETVCAVCGALIRTIICGDHYHVELTGHDVDLHRRVLERAKAAPWN